VPATPANAQERRTTPQMKALAPGAANRVIQDDLLSVLEPSGRIHAPMSRVLPNAKLVTRSYGTEYEGLCRRDAVRLLYAPSRRGEKPENWPIHPYGIEATPTFHIVHLPQIATSAEAAQRPLVDQPECVEVDKHWRKRADADEEEDDPAEWFTAPDTFHAIRAGFALEMALAALKAGSLKPEPCPDIERFGRTCIGDILGAGGLPRIYAVTRCPAETGSICYVIDFRPGTTVTITARGDEQSPIPSHVLSIAVADFIMPKWTKQDPL
jgi:hypothetical protein